MRVLLYMIAALALTACRYTDRGISRELDRAESLLSENPALALEQLNLYDVSEFGDSAMMARWALLYGEAMAANNLKTPTDTIINIAIAYYDNRHLTAEHQRACQLRARLNDGDRHDRLATALYLQKEKEFMLYKERADKEQLTLLTLTILLAAAVIIGWMHYRLRLKAARNESLMAEASALKEGLTRQQSECSVLSDRLSASLANRFTIIDDLCTTYYESQGSKIEKKAIVDKVKSHIVALKNDEGVFTEMEQCHADTLGSLRESIPGLKPDEYRLMVYLAAGLSNRTIALLIGESIDTAYKRKSRLKAKIAATDTHATRSLLSLF